MIMLVALFVFLQPHIKVRRQGEPNDLKTS